MKASIDCIPCIIGQSVHCAKKSAKTPAQADEIVRRTLHRMLELYDKLPPPVMTREIHATACEICGDQDLYMAEKDESTRVAHEVLASLQDKLAAQSDRFEALARLAIAGNIIDFGAYRDFDLKSVKARVVEAFYAPIDKAAIKSLKLAIFRAESILYIADNCGEAVFDRLFIEPFRAKTTLAVRGGAILNDLTRRELAASGLDDGFVAKVVDTGDFTPGISFNHSSAEFLKAFNSADLIISKGQGNYETLSDVKRPVFFLLRAKCKVVAELLGGVEQGSLQVIGSNIDQPPSQGQTQKNCIVEEFTR